MTQTAHGARALKAVFGNAWSDLDRETAGRDEERALTFCVRCSSPGCVQFAAVIVEVCGRDQLVCRACANKELGL